MMTDWLPRRNCATNMVGDSVAGEIANAAGYAAANASSGPNSTSERARLDDFM